MSSFATVFAILVTNIHYILTHAPGSNIQTMSPRSEFFHQHPKIVANVKSQHHDVINIKRWFDKNESFLSEKFSLKVRMMPEGFSSPHRANRTSEPPREKYIFNMMTHWFHESKIKEIWWLQFFKHSSKSVNTDLLNMWLFALFFWYALTGKVWIGFNFKSLVQSSD